MAIFNSYVSLPEGKWLFWLVGFIVRFNRLVQLGHFSPHWRVGFLFLVLYPPPRPPVLLTPHSPHSLTHTHSLTLTHSLITHSHSLTHPLTPKASFAWQAWDNVHCQGVGCTPRGSAGVPGSPPLLRGRRGTMCIAKGSDVRPGVPLASLGLRLFCVAGVGHCALSRGRMYAPGFRWRPWVSASFAWQAWDNVHCQGVGCTPRGSAGVPGSPPLLRGRRGTMCTVKGSDVRPGVPLASLGLRLFCVAGVGQCALSRGRMYAPGFRWRPWVSASFAWQAWDNVHCQGVGCTPRGSAGVPGSPPLLRGRRGTMCTPWGSAGVSGSPPLLRGRRGTMCTAKWMYALAFRWRPWVSASFAWQAWSSSSLTSLTHTHTLTHSLTHSLTDSLTHSFTHSLTHSLAHSLTHSLNHSLTHAGWTDGLMDREPKRSIDG